MIDDIHDFFACEVAPGSPEHVEFPADSMLILTNVSLKDGENKTDKPVRLFAKVKTMIFDGDVVNAREVESKALIASLIPGKIEQQTVAVLFSQFNDVTLEVEGDLSLYITGHTEVVEYEEDFNEEEEDNKEEEDKQDKETEEKKE